jgi:galactonate dehydratase
MKITDVEIIPVEIPYVEHLREHLREAWRLSSQPTVRTRVYRVTTDEGLVGIGEGADDLGGRKSQVIGRDPADFLFDDRNNPLQMACYDLCAQRLGVPIAALFGPARKARVPHFYWSHTFPPEVLAAEAAQARARGFTVHKIKARPWRDPLAQVAAMAAAVPPDYRIVIDANGTWEIPSRALALARQLEKIPHVWALETPLPQHQIEGYVYLKSRLDYPLAIHSNVPPIYEAVRHNVCDFFVVEFDWAHELRQQCAVAEKAGDRRMWLENGLWSGLSATYQTHQAAGLRNVDACITLLFILEDDLIVEPYSVIDGSVAVPTTPGLGVTVDWDAVERYRVE